VRQSAVAEFGVQPGASEFPVAHDGLGRDREHFCCFFDAESAEESQLNDASLALVVLSESVQGIFECDQFPCPIPTEIGQFIEIDLAGGPASLGCYAASRPVEEDVAHDLRGDGKEMRAMLPVDVGDVDQFEIGLMHQGSGLHGMSRTLVLHLVSRDAAERAINTRRQALQRPPITISPRTKELSGFRRLIFSGSCFGLIGCRADLLYDSGEGRVQSLAAGVIIPFIPMR